MRIFFNRRQPTKKKKKEKKKTHRLVKQRITTLWMFALVTRRIARNRSEHTDLAPIAIVLYPI